MSRRDAAAIASHKSTTIQAAVKGLYAGETKKKETFGVCGSFPDSLSPPPSSSLLLCKAASSSPPTHPPTHPPNRAAPKIRSDELVFAPGVVVLSILLGIHEDGEAEPDEHFDLFLYEPWGGARLGSQHRARVTISDAETSGAVTHHSRSALHYHDLGGESADAYEDGSGVGKTVASARGDVVVAGMVQNATLVARDAVGGLRGFGGDVFDAWVEVRGAVEEGVYGDVGSLDRKDASSSPAQAGGVPSATAAAAAVTHVADLGSGNYTVSYQVGVMKARRTLCLPRGGTIDTAESDFLQRSFAE